MYGVGHYIIWTIAVSAYLVTAWMLFKSEEGGRSLLGFVLFNLFVVVLFDALRVLIADSDLWFPFSISVIHGSLGAVLLYGAVIWISIIVINVRKAEDQERNT